MRRRASVFIGCLMLGLFLGGCVPDEPPTQRKPPVDSSLVNLVVDLRLVDARAELTNMAATTRDSLRALVLEHHGETETSFARRIDDANEDPEALERLLEEVQTVLSIERQGEEYRNANQE